jgi:hypothetical protein
MVAFAYVDADEYIDGAMLLVVLHRGFCRLSGLACNIGGKSRHPRYGWPQDNPAEPLLLAITSHPPDPVTAPRIIEATGGENHAGPGWPNPQLSASEDSNGGDWFAGWFCG